MATTATGCFVTDELPPFTVLVAIGFPVASSNWSDGYPARTHDRVDRFRSATTVTWVPVGTAPGGSALGLIEPASSPVAQATVPAVDGVVPPAPTREVDVADGADVVVDVDDPDEHAATVAPPRNRQRDTADTRAAARRDRELIIGRA